MSERLTISKTDFIKTRNEIQIFDHSLSYLLVMDIIYTIFSIMLHIYCSTLSYQIPLFKSLIKHLAFVSISSCFKLIISCFINGLVHEESERIYFVLDNINSNELTESEFKEWLMYKNISRECRFGLTIGGFAPLMKQTLIPVINKQ